MIFHHIIICPLARDVKDVRWHPQIPGCLVSTGGDGLNIWKTISV